MKIRTKDDKRGVKKQSKDINMIYKMITFNESYEAVMNEINNYIEINGEDNRIIYMKGKLYMWNGELRKALDTFTSCTHYSGKLFFMMAIASFGLDDYKQCLFYGKCALEQDIKDAEKYALSKIMLYCNYKLGNIENPDKNEWLNFYNNYDENSSNQHIKNHLYEDTSKEIHTVFSKNIDLDNLINYIRKFITDAEYYYTDYLFDSYVFKYKNAGISNNGVSDYINVVAIHGTNKIWTMYPLENDKLKTNQVVNDLPIIEEHEEYSGKTKVKRKSAIEKFNSRYKID